MSVIAQVLHAPNGESAVFKMCRLLLVSFCQLTQDLVLVRNKLFKSFVGLGFVFLVLSGLKLHGPGRSPRLRRQGWADICLFALPSASSLLLARALIPLTSRVDGRLLEVVAVGLLFVLPLSVDGKPTRLRDMDGPAEEPWVVGSAWARLLLDLLGRA